jgi:hypothetical protein
VNGHFLRGVISVVGKRNVRMHIGSHAEKTLCSIRRFRLNSSMPRSVGNHTKAACLCGGALNGRPRSPPAAPIVAASGKARCSDSGERDFTGRAAMCGYTRRRLKRRRPGRLVREARAGGPLGIT